VTLAILAALMAEQAVTAPPPPNKSALRPNVEVSDKLRADYFYQAYVIEHATAVQTGVIAKMQAECAALFSELQKATDEKGDVKFICVPTKKEENPK
jgi:hypothetical protein